MDHMPVWVELLIVKAIKEYLPPSVIADALKGAETEALVYLQGKAAATDSKIDDALVGLVAAALGVKLP